MLPTWPAVTTRSRSLCGSEPAAGAGGSEAEPSGIDLVVGSWWIVVDDLLYETHWIPSRAAGHVARWFYGRLHDAASPGRHPFGLSTLASGWLRESCPDGMQERV